MGTVGLRAGRFFSIVKFLYTTVKKFYTFCKMLVLYFVGF